MNCSGNVGVNCKQTVTMMNFIFTCAKLVQLHEIDSNFIRVSLANFDSV